MTALAWLIIAVAVVVLLVVAARKLRPSRPVEPPPPEYYESLDHLERLKSGRLWGDIAQPDPDS